MKDGASKQKAGARCEEEEARRRSDKYEGGTEGGSEAKREEGKVGARRSQSRSERPKEKGEGGNYRIDERRKKRYRKACQPTAP